MVWQGVPQRRSLQASRNQSMTFNAKRQSIMSYREDWFEAEQLHRAAQAGQAGEMGNTARSRAKRRSDEAGREIRELLEKFEGRR